MGQEEVVIIFEFIVAVGTRECIVYNYFLAKIGSFISLDSLYSDWFRHFSRIKTKYLFNDKKVVMFEYFYFSRNQVPPFSPEILFSTLQLVSFLNKQLQVVRKKDQIIVDQQTFRQVEFRLVDFLDYCHQLENNKSNFSNFLLL